jgi:AAA+ superfamily predicted ATPase
MNVARLTRCWQEAAGDPARMVAALCEELEDRRAAGCGVHIANAARLVRRWQEAAGDPARMAEVLIEELDLASGGTAPTRRHG